RMWWEQRRPEIVEDFEREVLGRVPKTVPKVTWTVTQSVHEKVGAYPVIGKRLVGHADNSSYPAINVDMQLVLVTPDNGGGKAPVMVIFRPGGLPGEPQPAFPGRGRPPASSDPPATEQLVADGWGYAFLNPTSIQADNGAGLTKGIIGLVNKGQWRKPD